MEFVVLGILSTALISVIALIGLNKAKNRRREYIQAYEYPPVLVEKLKQKYPHLSDYQADLVMQGLKQYFLICNDAGRTMVAMPSQAVDVVWHEFILFTKAYQKFCRQAFGRFLHHTPAEAMQSKTLATKGIKQAWRLACLNEGMAPKKAHKLPLLFALDQQLKIEDGFEYKLNCTRDKNGNAYCASHIGCSGTGGCGGGAPGCGGGCGGS